MMETNTTNLSLNYMDSGYEDTQEDRKYWCITENYPTLIISGVFLFVSLCGLVGNMVVIWFLGFQMKKNPFTVYVLNLSIADFSLLLLSLVILTLHFISAVNCFSPFGYNVINFILTILPVFCYYASMYLLTAMSMERCASVLFPIWYRCHRPKRLSGIMCGVLWALAGLVSLAFIGCPLHFPRDCLKVFHGFSTANFLIFAFFPLLSNLSLFIRLRCGSQRQHPGKLYVAILLSMIFMFIFGLPPTLGFLLDAFDIPPYIFFIFSLPAPLNSSINPVIYFLVGSYRQRRFQGSMKVALRRVFEEKATSEEESRVPEDTMVETTV
ncbi:proto-oncogene Mas-like [Larus michahellis]|uniref:proto-oncogene Mas-like n=1 Tax=Larus michahellis TaxID=119627 RepID=UPI003D9B1EC1